ncbi:MAG: hypothetical protein U5K00_20215 [Melioribacteraceae bacterium]|nr:hypothetical protein [Melioribacteraceae bacterium]
MYNRNIKKDIIEKLLLTAMSDNQKARVMLPTGKYVFNHPVYKEEKINLQEHLMQKSTGKVHKFVRREKAK